MMQLTYRGNSYELNTVTIPTVPCDVIGKYRGATLRTQRYLIAPVSHSLNLVYRGAHYRPVFSHFEPTGLASAL